MSKEYRNQLKDQLPVAKARTIQATISKAALEYKITMHESILIYI